MDYKKKIIVTLGGGYSTTRQEGRQALGIACLPGLSSQKGGQRHRGTILELIDFIGGDSYGC